MERLRRLHSNEEGQIAPALFVALIALLAASFMFFTVGQATDLRAEAVSAADAASLAAAYDIKDQLEAMILTTGYPDPALINDVTAAAAAEEYAARNGGVLTSYRRVLFDVWVTVETGDELEGRDAERVGVEGTSAGAKSRARVTLNYLLGLPSFGGGGLIGAGMGVPTKELAELADAAGVPVPSSSSLQIYGSQCGGGSVDVAHLSDEMKIAILKAENELGHPLVITSGYRTIACQAAISPSQAAGGRVAAPGRSMHNYGMAIDVANYGELASVAGDVGLCQPFPAPGDDNVHFSLASGPECGGQSGPLGTGGAYGGNLSSFVTFDVKIVAYDGL